VENTLRTQLVGTGEAFRDLLSERVGQLTVDVSLLAADFALKRAIATSDPDTLATVAVNCRERIGLDVLWITDQSGNLLGDASGRQWTDRAIGKLQPLQDAIKRAQGAAALNELNGTLFVFVAVPVLAPDPIGFLLAGSAIDDRAAGVLEKRTRAAVTLATASRVFATSWPTAERAALFPGGRLGDEAARHRDTGTFLVQRGDERLLSLLVPVESSLSTPLFVLVQQPYDRALQPMHALRRHALLTAAAALAGTLMAAALLIGIAASLRSEGEGLVGALMAVAAVLRMHGLDRPPAPLDVVNDESLRLRENPKPLP
jgi:adenylate cyclase